MQRHWQATKSEIHFDNFVDLEKILMLQNKYLDAKIGVDAAENEPSKIASIQFYIGSVWSLAAGRPGPAGM